MYETGLGPRYYLPRVDVRVDLLTPTSTRTHCPYKGTSSYWSLTVGDTEIIDALWGYETPLPEAAKVAGMVAFYSERDAALGVLRRRRAPRVKPMSEHPMVKPWRSTRS